MSFVQDKEKRAKIKAIFNQFTSSNNKIPNNVCNSLLRKSNGFLKSLE